MVPSRPKTTLPGLSPPVSDAPAVLARRSLHLNVKSPAFPQTTKIVVVNRLQQEDIMSKAQERAKEARKQWRRPMHQSKSEVESLRLQYR